MLPGLHLKACLPIRTPLRVHPVSGYGVKPVQRIRILSSAATNVDHPKADYQKLVDVYRHHPLSFYNMKLEDIHIKATKGQNGRKAPAFFYKNAVAPGILHVTPFARVMASSFTLLGSLGKNIFGAEDKIVDIQKAEYEMGIGCKPLAVDVDIVNKQYMEYEAWLLALFDKYLDHLSTNGNDYPMIKERFSTVVDKERQLRMALQDLAYEPSKVERDADGSAKEQGNYTFFKTKAFWPVRDGSRIPSTDPPKKSFGVDTLIEYVYDSKPSMVTLFDIQGKPIPRTEWDVREDDIVSIKATLDAGLFKVNDPKEEDLSGNKKLVIYMGKRLHSVVLAEEGGNEEERVPLDVLNDMLLDLIGWAKSSVTEERWEKAYQDYLHRLQGRRLEAMNRKKSAKAMTKETDSLYAKPKNSLYGYKRR